MQLPYNKDVTVPSGIFLDQKKRINGVIMPETISKQNDFAIIKTGGKQYKVEVGDILDVEKISAPESKLEFADLLNGKKVSAIVLGEGRTKKIMVLKFKNKTRYLRIKGHRQSFSQIKIEAIK